MQGAGGVGGLLAQKVHFGASGEAGTYYPTFDGNGNVSEYLDAAGAVQAHYEYDPFGETTDVSGTKAALFLYRFSTKPRESVTGLYYYGYRWYDPLTGRWPSRDPIGERGGVNLYEFVGNDGVDRFDRIGLYCVQTSFKWLGEARLVSIEPTFSKPGTGAGGILVLTKVTGTWERDAEVGCCCDSGGTRRYTTFGKMKGETSTPANEMNPDENVMIPGGDPMPFTIPKPSDIGKGVAEIIKPLAKDALSKLPGVSEDEARDAAGGIGVVAERLNEGGPPADGNWKWVPKWPCD